MTAPAKNIDSKTPDRLVCKSEVWITPSLVLDPVMRYFGGPIPLDPCTEPDNPTQACFFFTAEDDGLAQDWTAFGAWNGVFVNPPYGEALKDWLAKISSVAAFECPVPILALLPCGARFSTGYFQQFLATPQLNTVCWIKGRVSFLRPCDEGLFRHYERADGNPYDSALYGLNVDWSRFKACFGELGACWRVNA